MLNYISIMPWLNWGLTTFFVLLQFFLQAATGLMAGIWQDEFQLTSTQVGYLAASFFFAYVVMQIPVGLAYDRFGARKILCLAAGLLCFGSLGLALSHGFWQAVITRLLMGVGSSFGFIGLLYITAAWFSRKHFIILVGLVETFAMLGVAFAEVGMAFIISNYGWRVMMYFASGIMFVIAVCLFLFVQDKKITASPSLVKLPIYAALKKVALNAEVWLAGLYGFAMFAIINVFVSLWGIPFFSKNYPAYSFHIASIMMSMIFMGTALGALFNSWVVKKWQIRQTLMIYFAAITAFIFGIILYVPVLPMSTLFLLFFLLGFFSSTYIHVYSIVKDRVDVDVQATALAAVNMLVMLSAPALQPIIGKLLEWRFTFTQALSVIEIILVIAFIISWRIDTKIISPVIN